MIHSPDASTAKSIPSASALSTNGTPDTSSITVHSKTVPSSTRGSIEATTANFTTAARSVHASRIFGDRYDATMKPLATSEMSTASSGRGS